VFNVRKQFAKHDTRGSSGDYLNKFRSLALSSKRIWVSFAACALVSVAHADLVVPAGGSYALNGGSSDLGCTDLVVAGALSLDNGSLSGVRNVSI
jgi:hypothetical protein